MGDASHTEQPPALGSGGSFKSSVPMSLMGTQTTGRKESGPGSGSGLSPPCLPTSGGSWVPSPEVTLQVVLKTLLGDKLGPGPRAWN